MTYLPVDNLNFNDIIRILRLERPVTVAAPVVDWSPWTLDEEGVVAVVTHVGVGDCVALVGLNAADKVWNRAYPVYCFILKYLTMCHRIFACKDKTSQEKKWQFHCTTLSASLHAVTRVIMSYLVHSPLVPRRWHWWLVRQCRGRCPHFSRIQTPLRWGPTELASLRKQKLDSITQREF